jgi:hypothetical protein
MIDKTKIITNFWGGITHTDKSDVVGVMTNIESVDVYANKDYVQAEQVMIADTSVPASTEVYSFDIAKNDTLYAYGKATASSNNARIIQITTASVDNPGDWATLFTSTSADVAKSTSPIGVHEVTEGGNQRTYLYYISGTAILKKYGPIESSPAEATVGTLSGLDGTDDKPWMLRAFGELYIGHGQFIAHIDDEGTYTEKKFTLPNGWESISASILSDTMLILCRNFNPLVNSSMVYQWDMSASTQFDDSIVIPMGGPQWIFNHKEATRVCCAINGELRLYQLSGSFPVETHRMYNVRADATTQNVSPNASVSQKNGILYFGVYKTDKCGIYAIGQVNENKPFALTLNRRFEEVSSYATHAPRGLFIAGPNFFASYADNGTNEVSRCEGNNTPNRSSNAVIETLWIDDERPINKKQLIRAYIKAYPLATNTALTLSIATDYSASYTQVNRPDNSIFNTLNGLLGFFRPSSFNDKFAFKAKVAFTCATTTSPKLQLVGLRYTIKEQE